MIAHGCLPELSALRRARALRSLGLESDAIADAYASAGQSPGLVASHRRLADRCYEQAREVERGEAPT